MTEHELTRRAVTVGGATLIVPQWVSVVSGQTDSGEIELDTTSIVRPNTSLSATVYENLDGTGGSDNSQTVSLSGGSETFSLPQLDGTTNDGVTYWIEFNFSSSDGGSTAELDSATITLPESDGDMGDGDTATREPEVFRFETVSTGRAIFMTGIMLLLGGASFLLENWVGLALTALAVVAIVMAGMFGIGIELFWAIVALTALTIIAGVAARVA